MHLGKKLDQWFYNQLSGEKPDIVPPYSADWRFVHTAMNPLFEKLNIDELWLYWEDPLWVCELKIDNPELTKNIKVRSNSSLSALIYAAGEMFN